MAIYFLLPLFLGVTVVVQGTFNRYLGSLYGLSSAVLLNAGVFFCLSLFFYVFAKYNPNLVPEFLRIRSSNEPFSSRFFIPGICGFLLVLGLPWAIQNMGAARCFLLLIISQILCGFIWDFLNTQSTPHYLKILGAALTVLGGAMILLAP